MTSQTLEGWLEKVCWGRGSESGAGAVTPLSPVHTDRSEAMSGFLSVIYSVILR